MMYFRVYAGLLVSQILVCKIYVPNPEPDLNL